MISEHAVPITDLTPEQLHDSELLLHKYINVLEQLVAEENAEGRKPLVGMDPTAMALARLAGRMIGNIPAQGRNTVLAQAIAALLTEAGAIEVPAEDMAINLDS